MSASLRPGLGGPRGSARPGCVVGRARAKHGSATSAAVGRLGDFTRWPLRGT